MYEENEMVIIKEFCNYAVTKDGKVFNITTGKELHPYDTGRGYKQVHLYHRLEDGTYKFRSMHVHRLVAEAFVPKPKDRGEKLEVNHKNEDKSDNRAENLEWMTHKENCNYGTRNSRMWDTRRAKKEKNERG